MNLTRIPGSRIIDVARIAFTTPDVDFLCFGESDQPSPASARQALTAALEAGATKYSDVRGLPALREAMAAHLSALHAKPVSESRVQMTASGMAALNIALAATVRAGDRVVMHTPEWPNIANCILLRGATPDAVALDPLPDGHFHLPMDKLAAKLPGARAMVLNSPNNPTGWTASAEELAAILDLCRREKVWLIADEVYSRLIYSGAAAAPSLLDIAEPDDKVMVCNSFSKTWIMTGWRLGWIVLPEGARDAVAEIVEVTHSGIAPFTQHAGIAAVADTQVVENFRAFCAEGRRLTEQALTGLNGIRHAAPDGAFYAFIGIDGVSDSLTLAKRLVSEHKVAVAPGIAFGEAGEGHLRLCYAQSPARLSRALDRLRDGLRVLRP